METKRLLTQHVVLVGLKALIEQEVVCLESVWEEGIPLWHKPLQRGPWLAMTPIIAAAAAFTIAFSAFALVLDQREREIIHPTDLFLNTSDEAFF